MIQMHNVMIEVVRILNNVKVVHQVMIASLLVCLHRVMVVCKRLVDVEDVVLTPITFPIITTDITNVLQIAHKTNLERLSKMIKH